VPNPRRNPTAGRRPHLVTVKHAVQTRDGTSGEFLQSYEPIDGANPTRCASVKPLSGRELQTAREVQADVTHLIEMPWDKRTAEATPKCVIQFGARVFQVLSVLDVEERGITLQFLCKEAV